MQKTVYHLKARQPPEIISGGKERPLRVALMTSNGLRGFDLTNDNVLALEHMSEENNNRTFVAGKGYVNHDYFSQRVRKLSPEIAPKNLKNEDKEMRHFRRFNTKKIKNEAEVIRTPANDFNYALQTVHSLIVLGHKPIVEIDERGTDITSSRKTLASHMQKFARDNKTTDNIQLATEYIKTIFGLTLVKPEINPDVPDYNNDYYNAVTFQSLGDNQTSAIMYNRFIHTRVRAIRDESKKYGSAHVHEQLKFYDTLVNADGSIKGSTKEEREQNLKSLTEAGKTAGGRDTMRRYINALVYENVALRKLISVIPRFNTPDVITANRTVFKRPHAIVSPATDLSIAHTKLAEQALEIRRLTFQAGSASSRVAQLRDVLLDKEKYTMNLKHELLDVTDELLDAESHAAALNKSFDWENENKGWIDQTHVYFSDKVSGAIAKHRKEWKNKVSQVKEGVYTFHGQYKSAERVNDNDEVFTAYRDEFGDANISIEGIRSGVKPSLRPIKIRSLTLEESRRLGLWRKANSYGRYNTNRLTSNRTLFAYELAEGEEFPTLSNRLVKPSLTDQLYLVAFTIAFIIRLALASILPSVAAKWELRDNNFQPVELPDNVLNLGHYLTQPIVNAADFILEGVEMVARSQEKAFPIFVNEAVETAAVNQTNKYHERYFLWQPIGIYGIMYTVINGKIVRQEEMLNKDNKPYRETDLDVYDMVTTFRVGRNGYYVIDKSADQLGLSTMTTRYIPYIENETIFFKENAHYHTPTFSTRLREEVSAYNNNPITLGMSDEDFGAYDKVDTAGIEVPVTIDAEHEIAEQVFDGNSPSLRDEEIHEPQDIQIVAGLDDEEELEPELLVLEMAESFGAETLMDLVNTESSDVVVPDEILMLEEISKPLRVKVNDIFSKLVETGNLLDKREDNRFSIVIYDYDRGIPREDIHDGLSGVMEKFLDELGYKAEPYIGALNRMMVQLEYNNFHFITLFPMHGISEELAQSMYLALTGVGIDCVAIKALHHNWSGSNRNGYSELISWKDYGAESATNVGNGLYFEAQRIASKNKDSKWIAVSNAIPIFSGRDEKGDVYIAGTCLFNRDEFMASNVIYLPANLKDAPKDQVIADLKAINNSKVTTMFGEASIRTPNVVEGVAIQLDQAA